jgi:ribosomal protein S27AE
MLAIRRGIEKRDEKRRMSDTKKCPKCGGEMAEGALSSYPDRFRLLNPGDWHGDIIQVFYCKNCGYIEFYKEIKENKK